MMIRLPLILAAVMLVLLGGTALGADVVSSGSASAVWGQPDFLTGGCHHPSGSTLCAPAQSVIDAHGNLWVADFDNNRVLMYRPGSAVARKVFGQYGSFTSKGCNLRPPRNSHLPPAPSQYTLCQPFGLTVDRRGTLYVADSINNRVLVYLHAARKSLFAPADLVLGQANFRSTASNDVPAGGSGTYRCEAPAPASRCTLNSPMELSLDAKGDLLVPDVDNHRVLLWSAATLAHFESVRCARQCFIPSTQVWGQYGSFTSRAPNNPHIPSDASSRCTEINGLTPASACTLWEPSAALADAHGDLFIADTANNRVLEYDHALSSDRQDASVVLGQGGNIHTNRTNPGGVSASFLYHPLGLALDAQGTLWVSDFENMRVLAFPVGGSQPTIASQVLGQQASFTTSRCAVFASALCGPTSISLDRFGHAFVSDALNSRLLEYLSL